jgi:hypothetical protein
MKLPPIFQPSTHRSLILVSGIAVFWLIENAFPLFLNYKNGITPALIFSLP